MKQCANCNGEIPTGSWYRKDKIGDIVHPICDPAWLSEFTKGKVKKEEDNAMPKTH